MFITKVKRTIKSGFISFWRNSSVSLAAVLVMTVTLSVITAVLFTGALLSSTLNNIRDKVDVNVYFTKSATESEILDLKKSLEKLPEVSSVTYTSRDQALANFQERYKDDELTRQVLDELDVNPLDASFSIKAKDTAQYEVVTGFLREKAGNDAAGEPMIQKISDDSRTKDAIDALSRITVSANKLGMAVIIFFTLVSILITFNTIRLTIYIFKDEISVMRLVGASEMYIRMPFVNIGLMYGFFSAILTLIIFFPISYWAGPITENVGTGMNLFSYYISNFASIFLIVLGSGLVLGAISSFLAVKKYLKI